METNIITYKLWRSGLPTDDTKNWTGLPIFMGRMEGITFLNAVENYVKELPSNSVPLYSLKDTHWYFADTLRICETYEEALVYQREERQKLLDVTK